MRTYSREDIDIVVGNKNGSRVLTGVPQDASVSVVNDGTTWEVSQDIHGNVTRSKQSNVIGTIVIPLTWGHPDNEYLQELYDLDSQTRAAPVSVSIIDRFGAVKEKGIKMSITKPADNEMGATVGALSWELKGKTNRGLLTADQV